MGFVRGFVEGELLEKVSPSYSPSKLFGEMVIGK